MLKIYQFAGMEGYDIEELTTNLRIPHWMLFGLRWSHESHLQLILLLDAGLVGRTKPLVAEDAV